MATGRTKGVHISSSNPGDGESDNKSICLHFGEYHKTFRDKSSILFKAVWIDCSSSTRHLSAKKSKCQWKEHMSDSRGTVYCCGPRRGKFQISQLILTLTWNQFECVEQKCSKLSDALSSSSINNSHRRDEKRKLNLKKFFASKL